jgi:hypothetical protein
MMRLLLRTPVKQHCIATRTEDPMFIFKNRLFLTMICLLLTIFYADCLPAQVDETGTGKTDSKGKSAPSLSIKGSSVQTAPAVTPAGQAEAQKSSTAAGGGQPHLALETSHYDAGELWEGEDIIHTFTIRNTGTAQLAISNVKPG